MLFPVKDPGIYSLSEAQYHGDPCPKASASNSNLKILLNENPAKAREAHPRLNPDWQPNDAETKFDRGHACHILMLNDEHRFRIINADSYRSDAAKKARAEAYFEGLVPVLAEKWPEVKAMCAAGKAQLAVHADESGIFSDMRPEQTLVWIENIRGIDVWCRCKLDSLPNQRGRTFGDYKSLDASVNPDRLHRYAQSAGWHFQEAWYRRGIRAVTGEEDPVFKFVAHEVDAPYCLTVVDLPPEAKAEGDGMVDYALDIWAWCMKHQRWPGYDNRTVTLQWSQWGAADFEARKVRDHEDQKAGVDMFKKMLDWQAPLDHGKAA